MRGSRWFAVIALLVVLAAACGRSDSDTEEGGGGGGDEGTEQGGSKTAEGRLAQGNFGDLEGVCKKGDAKGATDTGVTDTDIRVATFTDKGFAGRPGLTKEMYDAAVAFSKWCNEKGGILGRKLVVDDRDAKLTDYNARILESCEADFAMVGGGAVFDDADNGERERCGLVNIAGYVVTPKARVAGLQVQPVPNPVYELVVGQYRALQRRFPQAPANMGFLTGSLPSVLLVRDQRREGVEQLGFEVVFDQTYNVGGESDWRPFVERMKSSNVKALEFIGEPQNLIGLQKAMDTVGYYPDVIMLETNFYDQTFIDEGGPTAKNTWVRSAYYPYELSKDNPATQDYLDLMKQYNPDGRVAQLGTQGTSAWLLFARAATECGSQLTRQCLLDKAKAVTEWTGGGLHGKTVPGANKPADCVTILQATPEAFRLDRDFTQPNQGIFNCDPANVAQLTKDYGVPRPPR